MKVILDVNSETRPVDRYWEMCVGSCHAATALREDYRQQLKTCAKELGFRYVRFHGLFDDDMSVVRKPLMGGETILSYSNIDSIFDFLLSIGMKPFIELSFMPECFKSGDETIFHYKGNVTPPADSGVWAEFITGFVRHLIERYGRSEVRRWYFEVWNEPNLGAQSGFKGGRFWSGDMDDYYELYAVTAAAVKKADGFLRVGGPATSNNAHLTDMIGYCQKNGVPLDFLSTHHYPTDVVLGYGVEDSQNFVNSFNNTDPADTGSIKKLLTEFLTFRKDIWEKVDRGVLTRMAERARGEAGKLPLFYTEWSSLAGLESDGPFGASFIVKTVMDNMGLVDCYSYWTFSDIFEEAGFPSAEFSGGYGLMTIHGIPKAPFNAFRLLHALGDKLYARKFSSGTLDAYALFDSSNDSVQILAVNHHSLLHPIADERLEICLTGARAADAEIVRVDDDHANALAEWRRLGSPEYTDDAQRFKLMAASVPLSEKIAFQQTADGIAIQAVLPPMGVALVTVYLEKGPADERA